MKKMLENFLIHCNNKPTLYAITCDINDDSNIIEKIIHLNALGVRLFQVRQKHLSLDKYIDLVNKIKAVVTNETILIINDNLDVAIAANTHGIHIGQDDLPITVVKAKLGENKIIGVSVQNVDQAIFAEQQGANYLGVGAMFNTNSKLDANSVSFDTLNEIIKNVKIPVIVIGGININNYTAFKNMHVSGIAMISTFFNNDNWTHDILSMQKEISKW